MHKIYSRKRADGVSQILETLAEMPVLEGRFISGSEAPFSNSELFIRDNFICLYCGDRQAPSRLIKDYVQPLALWGRKHWTNVVTACLSCSKQKSGRTLTEAKMSLLAVPYAPNQAEWRILAKRKIVEDQMNFVRRTRSGRHQVVLISQRSNCYA